LKWLTSRRKEGRNVAVVVGHPGGAVLMDRTEHWSSGLTSAQFVKQTITKQALAAWIAA